MYSSQLWVCTIYQFYPIKTKVYALGIIQELGKQIRSSPFFSIMADETSDVSNKEQLVICIRWVDENLMAHEDFIGIEHIASADAATIVKTIKVG